MADEKTPASAGQGASAQQDQSQQQGAEPPKGKVKLAAGGELDSLTKQQKPRGMIGRIQGDARERPGPLPAFHRRGVAAFTSPEVADRWLQDSAGIKALAVGDNVITMFGIIGEDFWTGEGVTAKKIASQLRAIGERDVEVHINSPGGDMFEGISIFNTLREHPHKVTIKVMGMAASAASIICMAADELLIGGASFLMIHNCSVFAGGNRHDHHEVGDFLEPFDRAMAAVYAERTGIEAKEIAKMLDKTTWLDGAQAVEKNFADGVLSANDLKRDEPTREKAKAVHDLRATELQLCASGMSRTDARERINRIKGTPGAAPDPEATPGAGSHELTVGIESLTALLKKKD